MDEHDRYVQACVIGSEFVITLLFHGLHAECDVCDDMFTMHAMICDF